MANPLPIPPPGFDDLSIDDKVEYLQTLWDRIASTPDSVPVPDWHKHVVNERLASYRANPEAGKTWEQVRAELDKKLSKKPQN